MCVYVCAVIPFCLAFCIYITNAAEMENGYDKIIQMEPTFIYIHIDIYQPKKKKERKNTTKIQQCIVK